MKVHIEPQVGQDVNGLFWMTVTASRDGNYWTSHKARLHVATMEDATAEAHRQASALHRVLMVN